MLAARSLHRESSPWPTNPTCSLNLGSLRSAMSLTLHTHTHRASGMGERAAEGARHHRPQRLHQRDEQDAARRRAGRSLLGLVDAAHRGQARQTKATLQSAARTGGPGAGRRRPRCRLGENMNVQPVKLPLFVNAQLGFMAV